MFFQTHFIIRYHFLLFFIICYYMLLINDEVIFPAFDAHILRQFEFFINEKHFLV